MDRKQAMSRGLTQEEEGEFYGELYHISTMNLDEYGDGLDGNWVYPTFATFSQCKDYFDSMTHEELLDEAYPDKGTAGIRFSIESTFCRDGEFDNDSDPEYWEQYKIVSWEGDKPVLDWSKEWDPEDEDEEEEEEGGEDRLDETHKAIAAHMNETAKGCDGFTGEDFTSVVPRDGSAIVLSAKVAMGEVLEWETYLRGVLNTPDVWAKFGIEGVGERGGITPADLENTNFVIYLVGDPNSPVGVADTIEHAQAVLNWFETKGEKAFVATLGQAD